MPWPPTIRGALAAMGGYAGGMEINWKSSLLRSAAGALIASALLVGSTVSRENMNCFVLKPGVYVNGFWHCTIQRGTDCGAEDIYPANIPLEYTVSFVLWAALFYATFYAIARVLQRRQSSTKLP